MAVAAGLENLAVLATVQAVLQVTEVKVVAVAVARTEAQEQAVPGVQMEPTTEQTDHRHQTRVPHQEEVMEVQVGNSPAVVAVQAHQGEVTGEMAVLVLLS